MIGYINVMLGKSKKAAAATTKKAATKKVAKESKPKTKRARSAYILFTMEKRAEVVKENPDLAPKDIMSKLATLWKESSESTKQKFKDMSDAEKKKLAAEAAS